MYFDEIKKIIFEKTGVGADEIVPTSHFEEDLNIGEQES